MLVLVGVASYCVAMPTSAQTRETLTLDVNGTKREFVVFAPSSSKDAMSSLPAVLCLHGADVSVETTEDWYGLGRLAEEEGFLAVYPIGVGQRWNDGRRSMDKPVTIETADDLRFIDALIDHLLATWRADPKRIYVTGVANGGMITHLAATQLSRKVAAIAPISRSLIEKYVDGADMADPVSVLMVIGSADRQSPYEGGQLGRGDWVYQVISVEGTAEFYAKANGCASTEPRTQLPRDLVQDDKPAWRFGYSGGRGGSEVVLYVVEGMGHGWPEWNIDTGKLVWTFFKRHAKE
jgi:polyhydroxybutyrate depolymerase